MTTRNTTPARPNIVLMVADDHGREALGCYGNSVIQTPHLDALAREGVRFTRAFCTAATCSASRSTILTGLHNHATGTYGLTHKQHHFSCFDSIQTLPAMLSRAGYRTGRVGKKHYAPERSFPFDWEQPEGRFGRDDVKLSEACRDFVREPNPFFLYWCSHNPHRAGLREDHPLRPNGFGNPREAFVGDHETPYAEADVLVPPFLSDTPEVRAELAQYYQSISRLDRGVGRLLAVLQEEGRLSNTFIVYISDNGAAFPEAKTTLYEPGMALPCLVRSPLHGNRGGTCDGLITWADITPTLLDIAGADSAEREFHGRSFAGILDQAAPSNWRDEVFASHSFHEITNYYPMRVVRTGRYKFIWNIAWKLDYPFASDLWKSASWQAALRSETATFGARSVDAFMHRPRFELYDLEADPNEIRNLADQHAYRELVETFIGKLKTFQEQTGDPWLHKWVYE